MGRRSTKLLRFENSLHRYNKDNQNWSIDSVNRFKIDTVINPLDKGTFSTCKQMSQKINPTLLRRGFLDTWRSTFFTDYKELKVSNNIFYIELFIKTYLISLSKLLQIFLDKIEIKKLGNTIYIRLFYFQKKNLTKRDLLFSPTQLNRLKQLTGNTLISTSVPFFKKTYKDKSLSLDTLSLINHLESYLTSVLKIKIKVLFTRNLNLGSSASLISQFISNEIETSNVNFKRALNETFKEIKDKSNIKGVRINCSGRLGKAPMAKTEWFKYGQIPLNKISAQLDYSSSHSVTKYGAIGTKVWLYEYAKK